MERLPVARRLWLDESGVSLLEMAIVLPFLLALGLGVIEFGNVLYQYHLITGGVRDAARFAAGLPIPAVIDETETECTEDNPWDTPVGCAKQIAITGQLAAGGASRVAWWQADDITIDYPTLENEELEDGSSSYRGGNEIAVVQVITQVEYNDLGFLDYFGIGPINITAGHEERHYGIR